MKRRQVVSSNRHFVSAHPESLFECFQQLHPIVQLALILSITTILALLVFNPVAGGVLVSFLLALRGISHPLPPTN